MLETVPKPAGAPADDTTYGALTVRLPRELIDRIKQMARDEERSINYIAARLLRQAVDQQTAKTPMRDIRHDPDAANNARLKAAADRATPKEQS